MLRAVLVAVLVASARPVSRSIDVAASTVTFSIAHIWVENVTGTLPIESGTVDLLAGSLIPTYVTARIDAARVATGVGDRDAALRSADFFDTARFAFWTFTSTRIAERGPAAFEMDGNLTIHGVTQPERLEVTVAGDAAYPVYRATAHIDRRAFGMAVTRLDPVIGGGADVTIIVRLR
jgi:polyisoprenoid-binding protein YceI